MTPEMQSYHDSIFALSEQEKQLQSRLDDLNVKIDNREKFLQEYAVATDKLADIVKTIETKELILKDLCDKIDENAVAQNESEKALAAINAEIAVKKQYLADTEKVKSDFGIAQKDLESTINTHVETKKRLDAHLEEKKSEIRALAQSITSVIE